MSGGSLNYFCYTLEEHIGDFGDKELDELVKDLSELFHEREWYLSGDKSEGHWNEALDNFKAKWFTNEGRESRIKEYFDSCVNEMKRIIGIYNRCEKCSHWFPREDASGWYGRCEIVTGRLMHRSENACENYDEKHEETSSEGGHASERSEKKKKFVEGLDSMFSSVWDCQIDHPLWQDTIGDFMKAVIQLYDKIEGGE